MSLFAFIKEQLPILDVVNEFVPLKVAGNYWKGPCPFHAEKDASFTVSPEKGIFYCFGCHASGDVISFMAKVENMTQLEATQHLIERYNITVPQEILQSYQGASLTLGKQEEKEHYFSMCKAISDWMYQTLSKQKVAQTYLSQRSITGQSAKLFKIGYFPGGATALNTFIKAMNNAGFLLKDLTEHGIIMEGRAVLYSPFEERIIFPITNSTGKFCGFGGRIFQPNDQRPKYYNSKESDGFEKGKLLFGFDLAKKSLQEHGTGFLVEGYMDCIMMVQYGYTNTVATLGTACTIEHLKMLSRLIHTLFVLYDGDQAGQKAMLRLTELCWEVNLELKVIKLPPGQDPASFLSQGGSLETFIANATDIITFFINSTGAHFTTKPMAQKQAIAEKITTIIGRLSDHFKQDLLLHQAAHVIQLPFETLKELMHHSLAKVKHNNSAPPQQEEMKNSRENTQCFSEKTEALLLEEKIFSAILNSLGTSMDVRLPKDITPYLSTMVQGVFNKLDTFIDQVPDSQNPQQAFLDTLNEREKQWAIRVSMQYDGKSCQDVFTHLLARFYKYHWQQIVKNIKEEIMMAKREGNNQKVQDVLNRFAHLKQEIVLNRGHNEKQ